MCAGVKPALGFVESHRTDAECYDRVALGLRARVGITDAAEERGAACRRKCGCCGAKNSRRRDLCTRLSVASGAPDGGHERCVRCVMSARSREDVFARYDVATIVAAYDTLDLDVLRFA